MINPLGVFAKTFRRDTLEANLDAVRGAGFDCVQYNLACAGLPTLPDAIDDQICARIREAHQSRQLTMAAISGTFNIIDDDAERRQANFGRLRVLATACRQLGTSVITLCTGTRDPHNMWRGHPENRSPGAWQDMFVAMRDAVRIGEQAGVTMAIEPEVNNVVDSARQARRLLDEIDSPFLKVVMDAANLFPSGELARMHDLMDEAFDLLGEDIVVAHAKDLSRDGDAGHEAAGTGLLDYDHYLRLLRDCGFQGPLVTHSLQESQVEQCVRFLRDKMREVDVLPRTGSRGPSDG